MQGLHLESTMSLEAHARTVHLESTTMRLAAAESACKDCASGKYNNELGQACTDCASGKYNNELGLSACKDCASGKYNKSWD